MVGGGNIGADEEENIRSDGVTGQPKLDLDRGQCLVGGKDNCQVADANRNEGGGIGDELCLEIGVVRFEEEGRQDLLGLSDRGPLALWGGCVRSGDNGECKTTLLEEKNQMACRPSTYTSRKHNKILANKIQARMENKGEWPWQ